MRSIDNNPCLNFFLIGINFVFFVGGALLLGGSTYVYIANEGTSAYDWPTSTIAIGMAVGVATLIVSVIGCCSTRSYSSMFFYTVFLALLIIGQVVVMVLVQTDRITSADEGAQVWQSLDARSRAMIQDQFGCCGYQGSWDNAVVSDKCPLGSATVVMPGCLAQIKKELSSLKRVSIVVSAVFFVLELLTFLFCIYSLAKNRRRGAKHSLNEANQMNRMNQVPSQQYPIATY